MIGYLGFVQSSQQTELSRGTYRVRGVVRRSWTKQAFPSRELLQGRTPVLLVSVFYSYNRKLACTVVTAKITLDTIHSPSRH